MNRQPYLVLLFCFLSFASAAQQKLNIDSLQQVIRTSADPATIITALITIGDNIFFSEPDSALVYFDKAEKAATPVLNNPKADSTKTKLIEQYLAFAFQDKGSIYLQKGDIAEALKYYDRALKIYEKDNIQSGIAGVLNNIGLIYETNLHDYDRALDCYLRSLKIQEEIKDKKKGIVLANVGVIYRKKGNLPLALEYLNKSLTACQQTNDTLGMADVSSNFAEIYKAQGDIEKGISEGLNSIHLYQLAGDMQGEIHSRLFLGNIYFAQNNLARAKEMAQASLIIAQKNNYRENIMEAAYLLHTIYKKQGRWKEDVEMYELYNQMRESVENKDAQMKTIRDLIYFENRTKALNDSLSFITSQRVKDNQIHAQQMMIERQQKSRTMIIAATLIATITALLLFTLYRRHLRQKENQLVINSLETEQKLLRAQMNPHFIFNSLNSIQSLILKNELNMAREYLVSFSRLTRAVLEQTRKKSISLTKEIEALRLYMDMEKLRFKDKFDYEISVPANISPENTFLPPLLIQPFVENSILHGISHKEGKGNIAITFQKNNGTLKCIVQDDGVGRLVANEINQQRTKKDGSVATQLARNRLVLMNDSDTSQGITITDVTDTHGNVCGTKTEINIHLSTNDPGDNN